MENKGELPNSLSQREGRAGESVPGLPPTFVLQLLLLLTMASAVVASGLPEHVKRFGPVPTSRVKGSPEPPPPFRVERIYPKLDVSGLIVAVFEPGTDSLLYVDRLKGNVTRLRRASADFDAEKSVTLLETNQVTYNIAFHPGYQTNGYFYLGSKTHWQKRPDQKVQIVRHTMSSETGRIEPASAKLILEWASTGHDGSAMAFAEDGTMFVTSGDGTSDSDDNNRGQGLDHLLAKVLRIDVDYPTGGRAYSIPDDNPFVKRKGARPETWAYGFRNPWRMAIDGETGHLWVTQNGQDTTEQVYFVERGGNYGWSIVEGSRPFRPGRQRGPTPILPPTAEHFHSEARSLTGGIVYHHGKHAVLKGAYIYGDYATGKIWAIRHDGERVVWHREIADTALGITAFVVNPDGELLVADYQMGDGAGLYRLVPNRAPDRSLDFPRKLSESGLFASVKGHLMKPQVIPYEVNAPLWSDGAIKARYLALPVGATNALGMGGRRGWDFPDGTVAVKSFALEFEEGNRTSRKWIETRFLTRQGGEWSGYSYEWNKEQTDATLVTKAGKDRYFEIGTAGGGRRRHQWRYPSRTECMVCHTRASKYVLGLSTPQMDRDHDYGHGLVTNQMTLLAELGLAKVVGKKSVPLVDPHDQRANLELRARSYLQSNCAICHVSAGGGDSQFQLEHHLALKETKLLNADPVHGTLGRENVKLLVPGKPAESLLWLRMSRRGHGQMPPLGTSLVDGKAVGLIAEWIRGLAE
jgi:uncharacterized repeat protein (TIGR03806 family)